MVFENLSVRISAATGDFIAGITAARERAGELGDGLSDLSRKASRADDSIEEAGDTATQTAGSFAILSAGSQGLNLSLGILTGSVGTLTAAFTGLLILLTPLTAGLAAFGAVAASIGLVGFAGGVLAATQQTERLKGELSTLVDILLVEFQPVTRTAANVLSRLITEFISISNRLAPTQRQISTIAGAFEQLGINVINAIPPLVQAATQLTAQFLPKIADSSDGLAGFAKNLRDFVTSERFVNFVNTLIKQTKKLAPELGIIASNLAEFTDEESLEGLATLAEGVIGVARAFSVVLKQIDRVIEGLDRISANIGDSPLPGFGGEVQAAPPGSQSPVTTGAAQTRPANVNNQMRVDVRVEGDTGVVRDVAATTAERSIREQSDRAQRNAGTGGP
ncbi:hypothetical protein OSG_eHP32_00110 [environmental Halophage eHP-32]|nr:hypothetical protein OSG_eHP32_00110 [environmental Halophage eHP-32]